MTKDLSYFMRETKSEVITVLGPKSIKDKDGKTINLEIKALTNSELQKIHDSYKKRSIAMDAKGNPYLSNGEIVFKSEKDNAKTARHIIVESLVYPNLKDEELMKFYNCHDVTDMPFHVFSNTAEYTHVSSAVMDVIGMANAVSDDELETAKN